MSQPVYFMTMLLPLGTVLAVFALKYLSAAYQARVRAATDASYRELAQSAIQAQSATQASLASLQAELAQVSQRLAQVSRILQDVE